MKFRSNRSEGEERSIGYDTGGRSATSSGRDTFETSLHLRGIIRRRAEREVGLVVMSRAFFVTDAQVRIAESPIGVRVGGVQEERAVQNGDRFLMPARFYQYFAVGEGFLGVDKGVGRSMRRFFAFFLLVGRTQGHV